MTESQRPKRQRGYLPSQEGLKKLEEKRFLKGYSYETLANGAGLASDDQVKRLFNPHWGRKVQMDTIERICRVLELTPTDIIAQDKWSSPDKEPNIDSPKILLRACL